MLLNRGFEFIWHLKLILFFFGLLKRKKIVGIGGIIMQRNRWLLWAKITDKRGIDTHAVEATLPKCFHLLCHLGQTDMLPCYLTEMPSFVLKEK